MAFTDTIDLPCRGKPNYHVFFITGNPGLIDYYRTFLKYLAENVIHITKGGENQTFNIFGQSLANFHSIGKEVTAYHERKRVIGLQDQIKFVETELNQYVRRVRDLNGQFNDDLSEKVKVILIGHSVGAYVCMEVLRRRREREKQLNPLQYEMDSSIIGFVGLWPTVTWIGRSPSGRIARWLSHIPLFIAVISILGMFARCLAAVLGPKFFTYFVQTVTGFPDDATGTTVDFLRSPNGVEQALYLARDEMQEITEDRWDKDIWGTAEPSHGYTRPKLILYFGQYDHWVADHTRNDLIQTRAYQEGSSDKWKPRMLVDGEGIPHSFCIKHNLRAAEKTAKFIQDIINTYEEIP